MKTTALITGASSGIGEAIARRLAESHQLVICGRRKEKLEALKQELEAKTQVHTLQFDVRDPKAVVEAIHSLPDSFKNISVLVNNAGNAHGLAPIDEGSLEDFDAMMDGNVKGLLYVSKAIFPLLKKEKDPIIVNISSTAGKQTYANGTVYCASKSAVEAISKGMRLDLAKHGIRISNVAPGAVETDFSMVRFKGDKEKADQVYAGYKALVADDIARAVEYIVNQPAHVQIADITIMPKAQADATTFVKE